MRRATREQLQIKQISKEIFAKFKKVRELQSQLCGSYQLYSKNGFKYVGKQLSINFRLLSTRNTSYPIFKYTSGEESTFLFPLHGQPLSSLFGRVQQEGEIKRWIEKRGTLELCLFDVLKKTLELVQTSSQEEIILECLRVHNGQLQYCYDNWIKSSFAIAVSNPNELENYYFSQLDLDKIKQLNSSKEKPTDITITSSKMCIIYRIFLMVLHLGSHNLKERNYEYGGYKLHQEHLKMRLEYFCSRHNQKGLGDLVKRVILGQAIQMEDIWTICIPQISRISKAKKVLTLSSTNIAIQRKRNQTEMSELDSETPTKHSHIHRLNCSMYSQSSNKSGGEEESNLTASQHSLYKSKFVNDENRSRTKLMFSKQNTDQVMSKKNIKLFRKSSSKDSKESKQYHLFSTGSKERLNLKSILLEAAQIPKNNIKLLKYFGLQEYLPHSFYEEQIIQALSYIHIKSNWVRQVYENGSIYLGEIINKRKQGKGLYLFNSNDFYFGDWNSNFMQGYGTYVFTSGEVYQGELKKGCKEGHGRCVYPDGKSYEGFWNKNCKIGLGKVKFPNEVIFIGLFKPHSPQTEGLFLGPMGQNQKPLWENKGILQHYHWQKNTLIENKQNKQALIDRKSKLKHCKAQYYSQYVDEHDNIYEGEIVDGKKQGFGIYQTHKDVYEGGWCENKKDGTGTLFLKNLFSISGEWKDNILIKYDYEETQQPL